MIIENDSMTVIKLFLEHRFAPLDLVLNSQSIIPPVATGASPVNTGGYFLRKNEQGISENRFSEFHCSIFLRI